MPPDRRLAAVLLAAAATYLLGALWIRAPEGQYAAVGPQVFPLVIGVGLLACALWIGVTAPNAPGDDDDDDESRLPRVDWRVGGSSALAFLVYVAALNVVGYLLATAVFIVIESRLLGSRAWTRDLIVSLAITASVYGLFRLMLGLRLPAGLLG